MLVRPSIPSGFWIGPRTPSSAPEANAPVTTARSSQVALTQANHLQRLPGSLPVGNSRCGNTVRPMMTGSNQETSHASASPAGSEPGRAAQGVCRATRGKLCAYRRIAYRAERVVEPGLVHGGTWVREIQVQEPQAERCQNQRERAQRPGNPGRGAVAYATDSSALLSSRCRHHLTPKGDYPLSVPNQGEARRYRDAPAWPPYSLSQFAPLPRCPKHLFDPP
jgi:hypothetical protein